MKIPFLDKILKKKSKTKDTGSEKTDYSGIGLSKPRMGSDMAGERLPALPSAVPPQVGSQSQSQMQRSSGGIINEENIKVKIDLMASQIDNMRIQQETINQKMTNIEQILKQLLATAHR